ncbi:cation:proton antiporter [Halarcobacter anaerophilus]|uniref:Sodium:proton exchanger n=1 Tax=Halarcobacter anaerophilus TaxID=877500 RepID=A0A4Q0XYZ3_9BACT|nr:cation:proton antiporter [Halarcobacter anaerophilus]QDF28137.1 glutathione-regulated potassium-efflux system protein, KefB/KefC family [Halarcobacter anaerophilus]RXJ62483.1 sodium:proton exchanger [Halarcobacter anaerophilus]
MLTIIVTTLFFALMTNIFLKRFNLPTIIGYIFTGTIIAYGFELHDAVNNHTLKEIAEFGVVFLMFTIGLEFSLEHLKKMKNEVFVAGTLQIAVTSIIVFCISYYIFDIPKDISFILSLVISLSSTAIVLKTFNETGEINKRYGQRSLGILIMQDIAVIPILLTIGFMTTSSESIHEVLLEMFIHAIILLVLLFTIGKYLLEPFFKAISKTNSDELFVGTILFLAIGASHLAHLLGFSYSLGAFIAGMLIAETRYKHQAEADLVPFRDLLLGIFFITVGMQLSFEIIFSYIHIILALLAAVMVLKFIIIFLIIRINENKRVSLKTALSLIQIGEFSLALLELAKTGGLVPAPYGQIMIVTIVLSMIATPIILKNLTSIVDFLTKNEETVVEQEDIESSSLKDHTIILGLGEFGRNIADELANSSEPYIAIENNVESFYRSLKSGYNVVFGNATNKDLLRSANLKEAKYVIVAIDNAKKLYQVCDSIQQTVSTDKIIVKVHTKKESDIISDFNISNIFVENMITSKKITNLIIKKEGEE